MWNKRWKVILLFGIIVLVYIIIKREENSISYDESSEDLIKQEIIETGIINAGNISSNRIEQGDYFSQIMNGKFECLTNDNSEEIERVYCMMKENDNVEWVKKDLNDDGIEDLVLQEKNSPWVNKKIVVGIFAKEENGIQCILWDVSDYGEFYYCGITGEVMYYYRWAGGIYTIETNKHYNFDAEWNTTSDYTLTAYSIQGSEAESHVDEWKEKHPDMVEDGYYYRQYLEITSTEEALTFDEFKRIYETEMGFPYDSLEFQ